MQDAEHDSMSIHIGVEVRCAAHLLRFPSSVPRRDQKHATGEESRFEETQDDSDCDQLLPIGDKGHTEHCGSPEDGDGSQQPTSANLSKQNVGRQFEDDVYANCE